MNEQADIRNSSTEQLARDFLDLCLAQHAADLKGSTRAYNSLYRKIEAVKTELSRRPGDQRRVLIPYLADLNVHVRMKAANALLAIEPDAAMIALTSVRDSQILPQAADAEVMLDAIAAGRFIPR